MTEPIDIQDVMRKALEAKYLKLVKATWQTIDYLEGEAHCYACGEPPTNLDDSEYGYNAHGPYCPVRKLEEALADIVIDDEIWSLP